MKTLGLVLALMVVVSGASMAATATYDIYQGWNLLAAPLAPFNPDPLSVFAGAPDGLDYLLYRFDPSGGYVTYDALDPSTFGNCLLGDGYSLNVYASTGTISYQGFPDGLPDAQGVKTDMWISLPGSQTDGLDAGGWQLIGHPFDHNTVVDSGTGTGDKIFFTDGTTLKNWSEAVAATWVDGKMSGNDAVSGSFNVQYDGLGDTDTLQAGRGYWIATYKDNLAMIVPAN